MSYEGYSNFLCKNGHLWAEDCNIADENGKCPICSEKIVWENMVDTTNDEGKPITLKVKKETICSKCKSVLETTYYIPKNKRRTK